MKGLIPLEVTTREGGNDRGGPMCYHSSRSKSQGVYGSGEKRF